MGVGGTQGVRTLISSILLDASVKDSVISYLLVDSDVWRIRSLLFRISNAVEGQEQVKNVINPQYYNPVITAMPLGAFPCLLLLSVMLFWSFDCNTHQTCVNDPCRPSFW
jgi:hypothetical protein